MQKELLEAGQRAKDPSSAAHRMCTVRRLRDLTQRKGVSDVMTHWGANGGPWIYQTPRQRREITMIWGLKRKGLSLQIFKELSHRRKVHSLWLWRGRVDGGRVDGGRVDSGRVDGGRVDGGRVDGGQKFQVLTPTETEKYNAD